MIDQPLSIEARPSAACTLVAFGELALHVSVPRQAATSDERDTIDVGSIDLATGGGTAILCEQLVALGHRAKLVPMFARDGFGEAIAARLSDRRVELLPPLIDGSSTTVAVISRSERGTNHLSYSPSDSSPARFVDHSDQVLTTRPKYVYSPGFPGFELLLERLSSFTIPLVADFGYRPWMRDVRVYRREVLQRAELVDHAALSGEGLADDQLSKLLREVRARGCALVTATMGERGAVALADGEPEFAAGFACRPVHTVGAGDAFVAGLIAGLAEDLDLRQALALGNATAASRISEFPRVPDRKQVNRLLRGGTR